MAANPPPAPDLQVVPDRAALAHAAAERVAAAAESALASRGRFHLVLSGGSTPRDLYRLLADEAAPFRARLDWPRVHLFWGDERPVPPDHAESNYRMAREELIARVPLPEANVHRIRGEEPPERAAADYEEILRPFFAAAGAAPPFDLALLGLGADGHTASLFPGSPIIEERRHLVRAPWVEALQTFRITLTPAAFAGAERALFLVAGADKAEALARTLTSDEPPERCPAKAIRPRAGAPTWLVDRAAASRLTPAKTQH
jgi:6-phosphogluconolactonase